MKRIAILMLAMAMGLVGIQQVRSTDMTTSNNAISIPDGAKTAVFAGGCFWCTESDFEKVDGVIEAVSGYTGGRMANPTYEQVSRGATSHIESVMVVYDPAKLSYRELLDIFWRHVDPTDGGGQFVDRGGQYRSAIFYADNRQKQAAEASKRNLAKSGVFTKAVVTEVLPLGEFYPAEGYHQDYYKKNPWRYKFYRSGSGRDRFLKNAWADHPVKEKKMSMSMTPAEKDQPYTIPNDAQLRSTLTQQQYYVVRENGTERPYNNEFWDNKAEGIYVDIVSGEPLFSSTDKYKSGTGWPSFVRPLVVNNIVEKKDRTLFMVRVEVRSKHADSHLGHVFDDGPAPTGKRYCINSAALRFVPKAELDANGYGEFAKLFASN